MRTTRSSSPLAVHEQRHLVDVVGVARRDDRVRVDVAEQGDLLADALRQRLLGAATMMSGWMPISRSSSTECWVGLVFSSPATPMKGTSVTWT